MLNKKVKIISVESDERNIMAKEIDLSLLFKVLKKTWWKILIVTVSVILIAAAAFEFAVPKKYASTSSFYILNTSVTSEYTTTSLLSAAEYLANDYIEIIRSDKMIDIILADIAEKGYTTVSPSSIRSMISASTSGETSLFSITVTSADRELAFYICDSIKSNAPQVIKETTRPSYSSNLYKKTTQKDIEGNEKEVYIEISEADLECIKVMRSPEIARSHVYPNVPAYSAVTGVLAAFAAYIYFLIRRVNDTVIRNENDITELVNETVIGDIPTWSVNGPVKNSKEDK